LTHALFMAGVVTMAAGGVFYGVSRLQAPMQRDAADHQQHTQYSLYRWHLSQYHNANADRACRQQRRARPRQADAHWR
jgi:hypothetical protein